MVMHRRQTEGVARTASGRTTAVFRVQREVVTSLILIARRLGVVLAPVAHLFAHVHVLAVTGLKVH